MWLGAYGCMETERDTPDVQALQPVQDAESPALRHHEAGHQGYTHGLHIAMHGLYIL